MGNWNLNLSGLGTHSPEVPLDEQTAGWASLEARSLIERLLATGHQVGEAILTHWPGTPHEVRENLITGEKVATGARMATTTTTGNAGAEVQVADVEPATATDAVADEAAAQEAKA